MDDIKDVAKEVVASILPVTVLVITLQLILFDKPGYIVTQFIVGAIMVAIGLGLFLIGVKVGLLPLGEAIGSELPARGSVIFMLFFIFVVGIAITVAEPDIRVLTYQIDSISGGAISKNLLISFVGVGVGLFLAIAAVRVLLGIPMSYILTGSFLALFILSAFVPPHFIPIAFDSGGVTTGPLTVPFIIALGVGITSVLSGKSSMSDSFGFVGLSALGPVIAVMLLGVMYG